MGTYTPVFILKTRVEGRSIILSLPNLREAVIARGLAQVTSSSWLVVHL